MRKIPTLFVRDETDRRYVTREVAPGCEWVLDGEGTATRKFDGTCVMFDGDRWWARREVKPGKASPPNYQAIEADHVTGKTVGWEPVEQSSFAKFHAEAVVGFTAQAGTYELMGPKINGNPEETYTHVLTRHGSVHLGAVGSTYDEISGWLAQFTGEGIVWHHPDGRMAKLKRRDIRPADPTGAP